LEDSNKKKKVRRFR